MKACDYVDGNGKINIHSFYEWNVNESNIVQLIEMCIDAFSKKFPLVLKQVRHKHIKDALSTYPGLTHRLQNVNLTDGSSMEMNCVFGTIPVTYR